MSSNIKSDALDSSTTNLLNSSLNSESQIQIANEFHAQLYSILNSKPPVSKEKVNQIVKEALKSHRHYKHVVYYVESFIKNCPPEHKLSGLYVIDALIRKHTSTNSNNNSSSKKKQAHIDLYVKRFSLNICKTFTNLFVKSPQADRIQFKVKINRVIELWQKYNVIEQDLIDKLNRISDTSKLDVALSSNDLLNDEKNDQGKKKKDDLESNIKVSAIKSIPTLNGEIFSELQKITFKLTEGPNSAKKMKPSTPPITTTKTEISKILEFDNDFDSDSDNQSNLKRKSTSPNSFDAPTSIYQSTSERLKNSISNCTAWLQTNTTINESNVNINDFIPSNYSFMYANHLPVPPPPPPPQMPPPPPPPPAPVPPPPTDHKLTQREKDKERQRRGLPTLKPHYVCICSKTIWLGHLSKSTTEDIVIDEIIELLSPSSSSNESDFTNKKKPSKINRNYQNIIVDVHLIPPRGCAYVEFIDRKMASKCLDRMKDNYRLDGNYIKVAWASNRGIEKDKRLKEYWNVDVGCTYIPWSYLDTYSIESIDFCKWAIGGLVDEDSLPEKYLTLFKSQMLKLANSDSSISTKNSDEISKTNESNDMDLDTDEMATSQTNILTSITNEQTNQTQIQHIPFQNLLNAHQHQVLPINFSTPPPNAQVPLTSQQQFPSLTQNQLQNQLGLSSIQVHPLNFSHIHRQFNTVFPTQGDASQDSLLTQNQNLLDLLNSQRNLVTLAGPPTFTGAPQHFQFIQRSMLMNPQGQSHLSLAQQTVLPLRKILLPLKALPGQINQNEQMKPAESSEITSTTQNEEKIDRSKNEDSYQRSNWKPNNHYNHRRSYGNNNNDTSHRNNHFNSNTNSRYSNRSNNYNAINNNNVNNNSKNSQFRFNSKGAPHSMNGDRNSSN